MNEIESILTNLSVGSHNAMGYGLVLELKVLSKKVYGCLEDVEAISCGEEQVGADGDYNDSDGMKRIYDMIQEFRKGE